MAFSTHREHSFRPAAAIASGLRVKFNSAGRVEPAGAGDQEIGVTLGESNGTDPVRVLITAATVEMTAGGLIPRGGIVRRGSSGRIVAAGDTQGGDLADFGIALATAYQAGDIIEVLIWPAGASPVSNFGFDLGTIGGTGSDPVQLDLADGAVQTARLAGDVSLLAPVSGADGDSFTLFFEPIGDAASGADVSLWGIATRSIPAALPAPGKSLYRVTLTKVSGVWQPGTEVGMLDFRAVAGVLVQTTRS